jgi:integrase
MAEDRIAAFLDKRLITSPKTRKNYRLNVQNYFKITGQDIDHYFNNGMTDEDYEADLRKVHAHFTKLGRPELSQKTFFNSVKQFMVTNDKKLKDLEFWGVLKNSTKGAEPSNDEAILNQKDIKTILEHGNTLSRSMFLMLASSGRRIGEILAIVPEDVHADEVPAWVNINKTISEGQVMKKTKTGKTRAFISNEAAAAYNAWIKERDAYLATACTRGKSKNKKKDDPRVFPMSYTNAILIWSNLLIKAKLVDIRYKDVETKGKHPRTFKKRLVKKKNKGDRLYCHPHLLRKYFRSYLGDADLAEYLMGHATVMTRTYRQMKFEDLAARYLKFMPNVTIFEQAPDLTGIHEEIDVLKKEKQSMKDELQQLKMEILDMKVGLLEKANVLKK